MMAGIYGDGHSARPRKTLYRARVAFTVTSPRVLIGARGQAKILANPRSLADRFVRYVAETFNFGA